MDIFGILDPDPHENLCGSETLSSTLLLYLWHMRLWTMERQASAEVGAALAILSSSSSTSSCPRLAGHNTRPSRPSDGLVQGQANGDESTILKEDSIIDILLVFL